jgi:hypothetical protein
VPGLSESSSLSIFLRDGGFPSSELLLNYFSSGSDFVALGNARLRAGLTRESTSSVIFARS